MRSRIVLHYLFIQFLHVTSIEWTQIVDTTSLVDEGCDILNSFHCLDGHGCIPEAQFCDDKVQCGDGSDEILYDEQLHQDAEGMPCQKLLNLGEYFVIKTCLLPSKYIHDSVFHCTLGEDECNSNQAYHCDSSPNPNATQHPQCIHRVTFCDGVSECFDDSDEMPSSQRGVNELNCQVTKTRSSYTCALPERHVCDGVADCDEGVDECFCDVTRGKLITHGYTNPRCFRCLDGSTIVRRKRLCDGKFHCPDLSDECMCSNKPETCSNVCQNGDDCDECQVGEFVCPRNDTSPSKCIHVWQVCDNKYDCPLGEDERNCILDVADIFTCADRSTYIEKRFQCDNVSDCADGSDEANCSSLYFQCNPSSYAYKNSLKPYAYEPIRPRYTNKCDLVPFCEDFEDECNKTLCDDKLPEYCGHVQGKKGFVCPRSKFTLIGTEVCDGYPACSIQEPEKSEDELFCPNRIYCADRGKSQIPIHIAETSRCDGISDCFDHSDELNCSLSTHFYCNTGPVLYVRRSKVCDGIQDCAHGEDECQFCSVSPFSSDEYLINSYPLQVVIWIIGVVSVIGNIVVMFYNIYMFWKDRQDMSRISYNHRLLVMSLATADLILGIYLINLGVTNQKFNGNYCHQDIKWRSSATCVTIGVLAVISMECSVFLLVTMATLRLRLITKPFYSDIKRRYIVFWIAASWSFAIVIALIPLSEELMDYFVSEVRYENNPFLTLANRDEMKNVASYIWSMADSSNHSITNVTYSDRSLTWRNMINTISILNETFQPTLFFGYYSAHGVCLPRLFPDPLLDRSWGFSLFVIIFNFVAFIYMLGVYIAIYRISTTHSKNAGRTNANYVTKNLQHKITRIIFTNFCCWIPICIMAFLSAAGYQLSSDTYAASAIILLPINSAFNPLLYSDLPDLIWNKLLQNTKLGVWMTKKRKKRNFASRATLNTYIGTRKARSSSKTSVTNESNNGETKL